MIFGRTFLKLYSERVKGEQTVSLMTGQKKVFRALIFFIVAGSGIFVRAQFTPEEIAQRSRWEHFLQTAQVVRFEYIGEGVTKPIRVFLKQGDIEHKAAFKYSHGMQGGFWEGWQYEIAAYGMDKLLDLNMIPPAVERELDGKKGAFSFWAESKTNLLKMIEQGLSTPDSARDHNEKMKYLTRAFDSLIGNEDRNQQNILFTDDWRTILIDHSRAFRSSKAFTDKLIFGADGIQKHADGSPFLFRQLPRVFVEKIRSLTFENIKGAVGPYLTDEEIRAVLIRRDLILKEIDAMIKEKGEAYVLY